MSGALHIGIVGCSAEGAALCYRTICTEAAAWLGPHGHPEVSMHTHSLAAYVQALERGDLDAVAALMLDSAHKLAAAGAHFLICPDNTIHQALGRVRARSPLPWLHIAEVVAAEAAARGHRRLGLLGTRWLVASGVYPDALAAQGLDWVRPGPEACESMNRVIMDELVAGRQGPEATRFFQQLVAELQGQGCDAVVLGCTEIPLVIDDARSPLPTLDSTRLLARAALRRALGPAVGRVLAVAAGATHGFSKPTQGRIHLLAGLGVEGDAHCGRTVQHRSRVAQDPTQPNLRQVHLLQSELFDALAPRGFVLSPGDLGENITTRGIDLLALPVDTLLQLGEQVRLRLTGLRNPCAQIDAFRPGLMAAVLDRAPDGRLLRKAGVMAVVEQGGWVQPGDAIGLTLPATPHRAMERV